MLKLTRKVNETILIFVPGMEEPITVSLLEIRTHSLARLGVSAPANVQILRSELLERENMTHERDPRLPTTVGTQRPHVPTNGNNGPRTGQGRVETSLADPQGAASDNGNAS